MSDTSETDIPVWVDGMVKYVTGLTRRTTCDDVIYALNEQEWNGNVDVGAFAIFERWCGVERPLKGRTKILKVWRAWGDEQDNVVLTLRRLSEMFRFASCESLKSKRLRKPQSRDRERERRRDRNEHKHHLATNRRDNAYCHKHAKRKDILTSSRLYESRDPRAQYALELNNNKGQYTCQTRKHKSSSRDDITSTEPLYAKVTRKENMQGFAKTKKTDHKVRGHGSDENNNKPLPCPTVSGDACGQSRGKHGDNCGQSRAVQEVVQLVLAQERQIQEQVHRIQEVDVQVDHYENKLHQMRLRENGQDYVQKAYIRDLSGSEESSSTDDNREPRPYTDLREALFSGSAADIVAGLSGSDLEEYLNIADELLSLEERLNIKQQAIEELSVQISEEGCNDRLMELPAGFSPRKQDESSLLMPPPTIYPGMDPADICWEYEKDKDNVPCTDELLDTRNRLKHLCILSRAQQQQAEEVDHHINGYDVRLNEMKEYANRLLDQIEEQPEEDNVITDNPHEKVLNLDDSIQNYADPRTSTPYAPRNTADAQFLEDFLASPNLKAQPSPKQRPTPLGQSAYTPYNSLNQEGCSSEDSTRFSNESYTFTSTSEDSKTSSFKSDLHSIDNSYYHVNFMSPKQRSQNQDYDSNSDTGLSSLHSDDAMPILETLV